MRKIFGVLTVLLIATVALSNYGNSRAAIAAWFGATDKPKAEPVTIDVLCDASSGSTCSNETLAEVVGVALRATAVRPESVVRLWMQGRNIETTRLVATATSPAQRVTGRHARLVAEDRWVAKERAVFISAMTNTVPKRIRRSPIAESIGVVVLAAPPVGGKRHIVVVTDALETSAFGQFECGRLPKPDHFARTLAERHVLPPGSLKGVDVTFCHVDLGAIDGDRCAVSLSRAAEIRAIWRAALANAGASRVEIRTGGLDSLETTTEREATNVSTIQSK